jgi:hypothetical protein
MKRSLFKYFILSAFICITCAFFSSCKFIQKLQERKIVNLENMVAELEDEYTPIKFRLNKTKDGENTIKILFLDLAGNTIKEDKASLKGKEVHFDFQVVRLTSKNKKSKTISGEQYLFFPYRIYSEKIKPENGIDLCSFYDEKGFPAIYKGFENYLSDETKKFENAYSKKISQSFEYILKGELEKINNQFGSAVHDMQGISEFKKGYTYSVICHPHTGGIEIRGE